MIVKMADKIELHETGMFFKDGVQSSAKRKNLTCFEFIDEVVREWEVKYPFTAHPIKESEIQEIGMAQTDLESYSPELRYHKFAGDATLLLDRVKQKFYWFKRDKQDWEEISL